MMRAKAFPLNAWYVAAWSHKIKHEFTARAICEKDAVLHRRTCVSHVAGGSITIDIVDRAA